MQKRIPTLNEVSKSPAKRMSNNNTFDRLSIRKRKPEMKDAWTQTTPKSKEQLEKGKTRTQSPKTKPITFDAATITSKIVNDAINEFSIIKVILIGDSE